LKHAAFYGVAVVGGAHIVVVTGNDGTQTGAFLAWVVGGARVIVVAFTVNDVMNTSCNNVARVVGAGFFVIASEDFPFHTDSVDTRILVCTGVSIGTNSSLDDWLAPIGLVTGIVRALVTIVAIEILPGAVTLFAGVTHRAYGPIVAGLLIVRIHAAAAGIASVGRAGVVIVTGLSVTGNADTFLAGGRSTA
jgi:hypothetical protein